jgi:CRISPR-associated protein Csm5
MTSYHLTITTVAPLHIGSGEPALRKGIDFAGYGRTIYVFDTARVLDYIVSDSDDAELLEKVTRTQNLASFLREQDFCEHPDLALYQLSGAPSVSEVLPQIKDAYDRPYLPGSSLKGALRTAIVDAALLASGRPIDMRRLGDRDKYAAQDLERDVVGRGEKPWQAPNYDLFRALHVADSAPGERSWLTLSNVMVWPAGERGIPLDVETVQTGVTFSATLTIDDYLFGPQAARLGFGPKRELIMNLAASCSAQAEARIAGERAFFADRRDAASVASFYADLQGQLAGCGENGFLLQLGWGTGWESKTVSRTLHASPGAVEDAVRRYRLDRGRGHGGEFPATRHLVVDQRRPVGPLGWVKVDMTEVVR